MMILDKSEFLSYSLVLYVFGNFFFTQIYFTTLKHCGRYCQNPANRLYLHYNTITMAYNDFKRYVWLIDLLNNFDGVTFDDIDDAWRDEPEMNPDGDPLPLRTFYNHKKAIKSVFDIDIKRSATDGKYRVMLDDGTGFGRMQRSLMSMLSLSSAIDRYNDLSGRILYEEDPYVYPEWMKRIIYAMNHGKMIRLEYRKYGDEEPVLRTLAPYCLKMFKRRWYLLAKEGRSLKTFALDDRTISVEELNNGFVLPEDFDAEKYFQDVFGIRSSPPKRVVLKAYGQEVDYLRSTPLHPSQKEEETGEGYSIFSLFVGINAWEFYQEILSHGNRLEVMEPQTLREDIADIIDVMRDRYA